MFFKTTNRPTELNFQSYRSIKYYLHSFDFVCSIRNIWFELSFNIDFTLRDRAERQDL